MDGCSHECVTRTCSCISSAHISCCCLIGKFFTATQVSEAPDLSLPLSPHHRANTALSVQRGLVDRLTVILYICVLSVWLSVHLLISLHLLLCCCTTTCSRWKSVPSDRDYRHMSRLVSYGVVVVLLWCRHCVAIV